MRFAFLLLAIAACGLLPPPKPTGPTCSTACDRMTALGCDTAKPTPEGRTCLEVCENTQQSGIIRLDLRCMTEATDCSAADSCAAPSL